MLLLEITVRHILNILKVRFVVFAGVTEILRVFELQVAINFPPPPIILINCSIFLCLINSCSSAPEQVV